MTFTTITAATTTSVNPAAFLIVAIIFGLIAYLVSQNYKKRHGVTPWGLPSIVWGLIGVVSFLICLILLLIASRTTKKPADQQPQPYPTPGSWGAPQPYGAPTTPWTTPPGAVTPEGTAAGPPPYPTAPALPPPGWHPDPSRRHTSRYWDGTQWTEHVNDGGDTNSVDPL